MEDFPRLSVLIAAEKGRRAADDPEGTEFECPYHVRDERPEADAWYAAFKEREQYNRLKKEEEQRKAELTTLKRELSLRPVDVNERVRQLEHDHQLIGVVIGKWKSGDRIEYTLDGRPLYVTLVDDVIAVMDNRDTLESNIESLRHWMAAWVEKRKGKTITEEDLNDVFWHTCTDVSEAQTSRWYIGDMRRRLEVYEKLYGPLTDDQLPKDNDHEHDE